MRNISKAFNYLKDKDKWKSQVGCFKSSRVVNRIHVLIVLGLNRVSDERAREGLGTGGRGTALLSEAFNLCS